ncbi:hypothetical protein Tco_1211760 [Tanacetum coccineum]
MKVKELLNVTFDESPPPTKLSPLVDDDVDEEEAIENNTKVVNNSNKEDESIEVDEVVNIKESKNHPLEQVIEPKNVNKALGDESWVIAMQEELNQFVANDVWDLVPLSMSQTPYDCNVTIRSRPSTILFIKERLSKTNKRLKLFKDTVFGMYLDLDVEDNNNHLLNYVLHHQRPELSKSIDLNLVFDIAGHTLLFERSEFCLVTGFACEKVVFPEYMDNGIPPFLRCLFPDKAKKLENKASLVKLHKVKLHKVNLQKVKLQ